MSVSAVLPVYNGGEFLAEAIESVYAQTRPPDEVIVVDDGSTDDTPVILRRFAERPGFRTIRKPNGGEASARNVGVEHATGEFVAFIDHDDIWRPQKLDRQVAQFDSAWGMSFTAFDQRTRLDSELRCLDTWDPDPRAVTSLLARQSAVGPPSTTLIRRDVLLNAGAFEDVAPFGTDWLMWLRIASGGSQIGYLAEPLTEYRWHGQNMSDDQRGYYDAACEVFDRYGERRLRARWRMLAAIDAHEHQDRQRARRRILQAARIRPWSIRAGWIRLLY